MVVFRKGLRACSVRMPVRARRLVGWVAVFWIFV
jgi:hypothetical protein